MSKETPFYLPTSDEEIAKYAGEENKRKLTARLDKSVQDFEASKQERAKALAALKELSKTELEALDNKLAGIEAPEKFPEGTGEVELSDEDLLK